MEYSDCSYIILGIGVGENRFDAALNESSPTIARVRRVALREWNLFGLVGGRCLDVSGQPDPGVIDSTIGGCVAGARRLLAALFLSWSACSSPAPVLALAHIPAVTPYGPATILHCHDGDTCTISIPSLPSLFGEKLPIRLVGIDTPEMNSACAAERRLAVQAKQFLANRLRGAQTVEIQPVARDKYFRVLALILADGRDLADELVAAGLAYPYNGGSKRSWCQPAAPDSVPPP